LKAAAICLAETAKDVMGSKRWGMFAFSDKLQVIKYYDETYDRDAKARIGGLQQEGLSHIPDAMRAVHALATDFLKEKNYIILVSDGIPSGYVGIEEEFSKSVRESGRMGAQVGAIGLSGNRVRESVRKSKQVEEKSDIVKAFIEVYNEMSF
jgi:nitric oxide reductase activation protein